MKAQTESVVLDPAYRAGVIKEILTGQESLARKDEHKKRREVYNDRVKDYVLRMLRAEMGVDTATEMQHRAPNINITRKVVDKKARVYKDRPFRKPEEESNKENLDATVDAISLDSLMKRVNAGVELHFNIFLQLLPFQDRISGKWGIAPNVLDPSRYDVIEDQSNPGLPMCVITSYYRDDNGFVSDYRRADGEESKTAEPSEAKGKEMTQYFVWWTDSYHFTTDEKGAVVNASDDKLKNPFGGIPGVFFSKRPAQDGYWIEGGDGLVGNALLFNLLMADMNYSAKYQSIGIGWIRGKGDLSKVNIGPSSFVRMKYEEGDPVPEIGFSNSNPALGDNMAMLEQFLAVMLSAEGLEPGTVTGKADAANAQSGIQEIIQRSEPTSIIEDEQQMYKDQEPEIVRLLVRLTKKYGSLLMEKFKDTAKLPEDVDYELTFRSPQPHISEKERLEILALKQASGVYSTDEILEYAFPDMDAEARKAKAAEIDAKKAAEPEPIEEEPKKKEEPKDK